MQQRLHTYTDAHKEMQPTFSTPESFQTRSGTRNSYIKLRLTTHTRTQMDAARSSHMLTHTTRTREHIRAARNNHAPPTRTHTRTHAQTFARTSKTKPCLAISAFLRPFTTYFHKYDAPTDTMLADAPAVVAGIAMTKHPAGQQGDKFRQR